MNGTVDRGRSRMPWGANWGAAVWAAAWLALPGLAADVATPNGAFTFVTLDRHLTSWFSNAAPAEPWSRIPIGSNSSNLPFDIKGRIELTGMEAARLGAFAPTEARGISVAAKARRLLILHATENTAREGAPLASVVVHYANSETRTFRLAYGVHARNWTKEPSELTEALDDPDSAVIWTSTMPDNPSGPRRAGASDRRGRPLRLFCTAWVNPLPDVAIQSLDFLSLFSTASPFIVAVTLDHQPVDPATRVPSAMRRLVRKANEFKDGVYRGELVVKVRDAKGDAPVSNAIVNLTVVDDEVPFFFGEARADGDGRVVLAYPPQHLVSWVLQVRAPGFAPLFQRGSALDLDTGPAERIVRLDSGISVGGVIRNKQGAGIAGAKVALYEVFACGAKEYLRADHSVAVTDAQGRWRGRVRSSQVAGLHLEVTHPEFKPALTVVDATNAMVTAAGLLGGNAELVVEPALRMEWLVLDREGRPVPRADVYVQNPSDRAPLPPKLGQTDAQGRVVFATPEPMNVTVFVLASGFAPRSDSFQVEDGARREIRLSPRRPLRGRVVDRMAKPIAGVQVSVEDWQGTELLSYAGQTDSEGRFEWADAPEDNVSIEFSKAGFTSTSYSTSAQAGERRFTLQRMLGVSGLVLDAETRQPIENFIVTRGRAYNPAEPMRWDRYESQRGRNGQYTIRSYDYGPSSRFCVKVEAPGYLPAVSPIYTGADFYTNNFELRRGRGPQGVVQLPSGEPVAGASVVLVETTESAYLDRSGQFRSGRSYPEVVRSGPDGRFEFAAKLEPDTIPVSHEKGYAEVKVSALATNERVVLQPWGRVTGVLRVGPKVEPDHRVVLGSWYYMYEEGERQGPPVSVQLSTTPDDEGRFTFDRVPPGERKVELEYKIDGRRYYGGSPRSHGVPVDVKPGQTTEVRLGGTGRSIVGRVRVVGAPQDAVDWQRDTHSISLITPSLSLPSPSFAGNVSEQERQRAFQEYERRRRKLYQSEEGRELDRRRRTYALLFDTNGTFRAHHIPPGHYALNMTVSDPGESDGSYRQMGYLHTSFEVPEDRGADPLQPVDVGTFDLRVTATLRIGQMAPGFEAKTFDGRTLRLSDFRGKPVLLEFWATWSGSRSIDLTALRGAYDAYAKDGRSVIIGLNLDHDRKEAETFLQANAADWPQCYIGPWNESPIRDSFGVEGIPAAVLIDAEGRVARKNLSGAAVRNALRDLLAAASRTNAPPRR